MLGIEQGTKEKGFKELAEKIARALVFEGG